jgi:sugar lactone lactonase YvrE
MFPYRRRFGLSLAVAALAVFGCGRSHLSQLQSEGTDARARSNDAFADQGREDVRPQETLPDAKVDASQDMPTLSLLAGNIGGAGSLDGIGPEARFCLPTGMANDGAGNLFVTDNGSQLIRKVVLATGEVSTVAGRAASSGAADGIGADARFSSPQGLASDGAGNLFVADYGNHAIRRIDLATGRVATLAGSVDHPGVADGIGAEASFMSPAGIAADGAGSVYVTDQDSHTIRKIRLADGQVTTLAGQAGALGNADGVGPAARFYSPDGIAVDGRGKLFVADVGNGAIRAITLANAEVTTLNSDTFRGPAGIASDGTGQLYITDRYDGVLRVLSALSGATSLVAGKLGTTGYQDGTGLDAAFASPRGVAVDGKGHVFVADQVNHALRQVTIATGVVTTLAGRVGEDGSEDGIGERARFGRIVGLASDGQGNLFGVDNIIRRVVIATGSVTTFAANLASPTGIASDGQGSLFVTESNNHTIRRIAVATAEVTTLAGAAGVNGSADGVGEDARFSNPSGIAADDAGNLFVSDAGSTIRKIVISTRTVTTLAGLAWTPGQEDGVGSRARFSSPMGLAWDAGRLFVADAGNHTIRRVLTADGTVTTVAGSPGEVGSGDGAGLQARFDSLYGGLALDPSGHLFIVDGATIRKLTIATGVVTTVVGSLDGFGIRLGPLPGSLGGPSGLVFVEPGTLFIADSNALLRADF